MSLKKSRNRHYVPIIGLEVHVESKTKSKMFCSCSAEYFGHDPNTHVCPVCLGLPGALPVPNKQAIEWCYLLGLSLNCQIPNFSKFDRKNYFYPDLPKGYQISQYDLPFARGGWVKVGERKIGLRRVHQEEDTGKLIHQEEWTLIDFNRSGVPLVEIVTEPEIHSSQEAKLFLQKLAQIIRYLGISDCDMEKGSMRLEPNISLSGIRNQESGISGVELPNYKVEVKNINSFRFVERAINYEIERQVKLLESGQTPIQETRGFDEKKQITLPQRGKEEAQDYRYFPEPDIPPIRWPTEKLANLRGKIPELPEAKRSRLISDYGLLESEAKILGTTRPLAEYFEEAVKVGKSYGLLAKQVAIFLINRKIDPEEILPAELIRLILQKRKVVTIPEKKLKKIVKNVLRENPKAVGDYKEGKTQALMFLVGEVLKRAGKTDPQKVRQGLWEELKNF